MANHFGKILSLFIFFITIHISWSATYYVSTTGVDGVGYGTAVGTPYRTLAYLFSNKNLNAGDVVNVAAGTYTEKTITVGSDDEGFTLQGAALSSGVPTTIFDSDQTSYWLRLSNTAHDNITIKNILVKDYITHSSTTLTYGGAGLFVTAGAKGNQVVSCIFDNCDTRNTYGHSGGAIYANDGITVTDCTFRNCYAEKNGGAVAIVGASSVMNNSSIVRCKFYSNTNNGSYNGIALYYATDNAYPSSPETLSIVNCLFNANGGLSSGSGTVYTQRGRVLMTNCTVTNNTGSVTGGLYSTSNGNMIVSNTIIYNNNFTLASSGKADIYAENSTSSITLTNCLYTSSTSINSINTQTNCITGNPSFVLSGDNPYSLQTTSIGVNAGTSVDAPVDDLLSNPRIGLPDIGAYESTSTPAALPIELLSLSGSCTGAMVQLNWTTATEKDNAYFSIFKSNRDGEMSMVGSVQGAMNSNTMQSYEFRDYDRANNEEWIYYELYQTDIDGNTELVKSIVVAACTSQESFHVVKHGDYLSVSIQDHHNIPVQVILYNTIGQQVFEKTITPDASSFSITLPLPTMISGSVVIVQLSSSQDALNTKIAF